MRYTKSPRKKKGDDFHVCLWASSQVNKWPNYGIFDAITVTVLILHDFHEIK